MNYLSMMHEVLLALTSVWLAILVAFAKTTLTLHLRVIRDYEQR